jgi:hypothetical protein
MKYTTDQLLSMAARGKTKRTRILLREASAKYLNAIKPTKRR